MKKELSETGTNGVFKGYVKISLNYKQKPFPYRNPSTHDDEIKTRFVHKIEAFVNDRLHKELVDIIDESILKKEALKFEKDLNNHLHFLANHQGETAEDYFKNNGYK